MRALSNILLIAASLLLLAQPALALLQPGERLPQFTARSLDGKKVTSSSLQGKPLLLKIGTTWCSTCKKQSKILNRMQDFFAANGIDVVDVYVQQSAEKVRNYFDSNNYRKPDLVLLDDGEISGTLNVYLIPRIILLDRELRVIRDGADLSAEQIRESLKPANKNN